MSLFKLFMAGVCLMVSLSACGFESIYARKDIEPRLTTSFDIGNIPDREGQYLRNQLIDRLYMNGRPANAPHLLTFSPLAKNIVHIGIQKDATATRAQIQITTRMQLVDKNTQQVLLQRDLKTVGAYNLLDNQLATLVSQQNITENILQELANDVVTELSLYFRRTEAGSP